ncbi:MAG: DUF4058 family protein [Pirellulales bacterium]
MPSPFPGFDPYLEAPSIWPDLHDRLAELISAELNRTLPAPYYARLDMRQEVGIVDDQPRAVVPDVSIVRAGTRAASKGAIAVLEGPRTEPSKGIDVTVELAPIRHPFVEIRDASRGHKLVTLIEIVSPSNKRPGADRRAYQQKQREVLDSDASLVEIDLLRNGERPLPNMNLEEFVAKLDPQPDYVVSVNRAWRRVGVLSDYELFPIGIRETLPCIPIPLTKDLPEPTLDLQWVFNQAYDRGPYRRGAVDYDQPPVPPLAEAEQAWVRQLLAERRAQRT